MSTRLQDHLATIQLVQAMYPLPSELILHQDTAAYLQTLSDPPQDPRLPAFELSLFLDVQGASEPLELWIKLLFGETDEALVLVSIRQPAWLNRGSHAVLLAGIPAWEETVSSSDYLLPLLEELPDHAAKLLGEQSYTLGASTSKQGQSGIGNGHAEPSGRQTPDKLERVWYWFPSLSSKEKRRDLVTFAEEDGLTGFVLAGKPGLLCVEGDGRTIDRYMARIKSESWSDIPPHQKKANVDVSCPLPPFEPCPAFFLLVSPSRFPLPVRHHPRPLVSSAISSPPSNTLWTSQADPQVTERLRRPLPCPSARAFPSMSDITDQVPHYGQYAHRGEMGEVRRLMEVWGVGKDFGAVVMNSGA